MANSNHVHHGIDYIEFVVTDLAKAKSFYSSAFGWKFNDYGPSYAGIQKENGEVGGLRLDKSVVTGGPLVILYSNNLDKSVEAVTKAGGKITKTPFEFPGGRRFEFQDPSGNQLAVWSEK
ncbi:MAG: VOC family protein [Bdellovibrionales bacterium]|nr:VOC family protein [Bdellovibrionales bacterium]